MFRFLIREVFPNMIFPPSSIARCGEPLNPEVFYQFKRLTGLELTEGFGQTESSVLMANFEWFPIKPGSMGKPSPLYDIDIVDENGEPCEDGIVGHVVVKNAVKDRPVGLFWEYYKDEAAISGPGMTACMTRVTRPGGMQTDITGLSAAVTMSLSVRDTALGLLKWKML